MKFIKGKISVAKIGGGTKEIWVRRADGGNAANLAYNRAARGHYLITHVPSGYYFPFHGNAISSEKQAQKFILLLAGSDLDLSKPLKELLNMNNFVVKTNSALAGSKQN